jgi:hypothetical protein
MQKTPGWLEGKRVETSKTTVVVNESDGHTSNEVANNNI